MPGPKSSSKHFRFAVTWTSLTAHLEPCSVEDRVEVIAEVVEVATYMQPTVILPATFVAPPLAQYEEAQAPVRDRWEMVVPKMERPERKTVAARAMAAVGRHTRALLAAPEVEVSEPVVAVIPNEPKHQPSAREISLSKIYSALQRRSEQVG
jgi:hypothetical protein